MSLESWKAEFYPVSAEEAANGPTEAAIEHSLRKWIGLRSENLSKHGGSTGIEGHRGSLKFNGSSDYFFVNGSTCALCQAHRDCEGCPILAVNGGWSCDLQNLSGTDEIDPPAGVVDAWRAWPASPEPMIELLERTLEHWRNK